MKYLSLFSGIGGFELGIEQAYESYRNRRDTKESSMDGGIATNTSFNERIGKSPTCIGYSEIDKYAVQIYQKHFPEHKNYGDITKISTNELPDFDLLVGGFPCQAFSIAGKRKGFDDTRGTLFFEIARILRDKQPRLFLLENVKGLLSHDNGKTFSTIVATLDELGYDLQWQVLNSKNHGVPQNRERVFIIGHLRGTPRPEVFPFGTEVEMAVESREPAEVQIASTLAGAGGHIANGEYKGMNLIQINKPTHSNDRVYDSSGLAPTLNCMQGGLRQPFVVDPQGRTEKECKPSNIVPTLRANTHGNLPVVNAIRRLTPRECERLQGFPDGWTEGVSDTQRYKCLGNAVTVNVIRDIISRIV